MGGVGQSSHRWSSAMSSEKAVGVVTLELATARSRATGMDLGAISFVWPPHVLDAAEQTPPLGRTHVPREPSQTGLE